MTSINLSPESDEDGSTKKSDQALSNSMVDKIVLAPQEIPEFLGDFQVLEKIGSGTAGHVYRGLDEALGRSVALKWMTKNLDHEAGTMRFQREAKAMASIRHENVVQIYSTGQHQNRPFIVMAFLQDGDLQKELEENGPLPIKTALKDMRMAARGLQAAYLQNIIHRDVKPANLLRDKELIKVADFGLAREQSVDSSLTATGLLTGTPYYVAPEIIQEGHGDHRSDIYSLGASFFHLLTGQAPFQGKTIATTLFKHVSETIPEAHKCRKGISKALSKLLQRCMAKDPRDRYQNYQRLISDIDALLEGRTPASLEERPKLQVTFPNPKKITIAPKHTQSRTPSELIRISARLTPRVERQRDPAGLTSRILALTIDAMILSFTPNFVASFTRELHWPFNVSPDTAFLTGLMLSFALLCFIIETRGSPGKALFDLHVRRTDYRPPGFFERLLRFLSTRLLLLIPLSALAMTQLDENPPGAIIFTLLGLAFLGLLSFASAITNKEKRSLHDRLSGTRVVKESQNSGTPKTKRDAAIAYLLWLPPLGFFGLHRFYLGYSLSALLYLLTFGFFGCGWLLDAFLTIFLCTDKNSESNDHSTS